MKAELALPSNPRDCNNIIAFNHQLLSYRQTAEWGNCAIQGAFRRLCIPLPANDPGPRSELIEICLRLHNVRARLVGLNQIQSVYMPLWEMSEEEKLWEDFDRELFPSRSSCVAQFQAVPVQV